MMISEKKKRKKKKFDMLSFGITTCIHCPRHVQVFSENTKNKVNFPLASFPIGYSMFQCVLPYRGSRSGRDFGSFVISPSAAPPSLLLSEVCGQP